MITQDLLDQLLPQEWLPKSFEGQLYLAKLHVSATESTALTFLITDTKSVWAEALTSNRLARRFRELNRNQPPERPSTDQAEAQYRSTSLQIIQRIHSLRSFATTSFGVTDSMYADKSFTFELEDYTWTWEADSLGAATAAAVLSQHLLLPLAATAGLALQGPQYVSELNESDLEDKIDTTAQDYRRLPALKFSQLFRKPRFATSLQRVTAVLNHVEGLPPILLDFGSESVSQLSNTNYRSAAPSYEPLSLTLIPPLAREPSLPPVIPHSTRSPRSLRAPTPPAVVTQRVPSQKIPSPSPTSEPMDVDEAVEGDITEADTDTNSVSPAQMKSNVQRKAAVPSSESPRLPAAKKQKVREMVPTGSDGEDDSEVAKLKLTSKGKKRALVMQDSESDDSLPAGRGRGRGSAFNRVKQPLKRGGRRL